MDYHYSIKFVVTGEKILRENTIFLLDKKITFVYDPLKHKVCLDKYLKHTPINLKFIN